MTIHILVEGSSEFALLQHWARRLLKSHPVKIHPLQGKGNLPNDLQSTPNPRSRGLLDQLPAKLRGFAKYLRPETDRVLVLVDSDDDDTAELTTRIEHTARTVSPELRVIVRLAVEETEAFYLGDLTGLKRAFPRANLKCARAYRPDSICGTWELFGRVVGDAGGNKVDWAERMGPVLTTDAKRSRHPLRKRADPGRRR